MRVFVQKAKPITIIKPRATERNLMHTAKHHEASNQRLLVVAGFGDKFRDCQGADSRLPEAYRVVDAAP